MASFSGGVTNPAQHTLCALIRLYQRTLSLDHGPLRHLAPEGYCKFDPSCSEYTYQAIARFGALRGVGFGVFRIVRCNPWTTGGPDPVPGARYKGVV